MSKVSSTLRAIVRAFGPAEEAVAIETYEPGRPMAGQVRIRMTARSINPSDLVTISGAYASRTTLPFVPGFEGVGIVEDVGEGVAGIGVGDRVMPIGSAGAWQDIKLAEARWCFRVAPDLSDDEAATSYINPMTAWLMLHDRAAAVGPHSRIAVNAAASAIGRIIICMANRAGAAPVALVRSVSRSRPLLGGLRLSAVIETGANGGSGVAEELRAATDGEGLDLALDAVGGTDGEQLALVLKPGGRLIHYGLLSGVPLPHGLPARRPDIGIELFWLRNWIHAADRTRIEQAFATVSQLIRDGVATSPIEGRYPLEAVRDALRHNGGRGRGGKILLVG
jgi:NADPH:quinone reductase-like Zn-dependent oxidoreductase